MSEATQVAEKPASRQGVVEAQSVGSDEWAYWRAAVGSRRGVETDPGNPRSGYYRLKDEAIAFWREDGEVVCWRSGTKFPAPTEPDRIDELFGWCAPYPISFEDFTHFQQHGRWPDQLAPVEVADDLLPHERADAELTAQREAMAEWVKAIGKIATQEHANKAGNFADAFAKIEKASDEARKAEKEPHLETGRAVDAKWQPIVKRASELKAWAKKSTEPFLLAERQRLIKQAADEANARIRAAREAEEARQAAEATEAPPPAVEPAPLPAAPPQKAKAGKVHLRTETTYEVENVAAFLRWLAAQNNLPEDFLASLKTLGTRMVKAGIAPDGVVVKSVERAA
jgi:hypothetical protein